jgi:uncharacterized caspase-like protein
MRTILVASILIALSEPGVAQPALPDSTSSGEVRVALVIGNNKHPVVPLTNAVSDATAMKTALEGLGFQVTLLTDAGAEEMDRAIFDDFIRDAIKKDSIAVIYFAGHGVEFDGVNYLIPSDLKGKDKPEVKHRAVSVTEVLERMQSSPARIRLLILDACRDNPYRSLGDGAQAGLKSEHAAGTYIAYSTAPGQTALDDSVFTPTLVQELADKKPGSTLDQVFTRVRTRVSQLTAGHQVPFSTTGLEGEWYPFGLAQRRKPNIHEVEAAEKTVDDARALIVHGEYDKALAQLDDAVQTDPDNSSAYVYRGLIRGLNGDREGELSDFSEVIRVAPSSYLGFLNRALALKNSGNCMQALQDFDKAAALAPEHAAIYRYRASCKAEIGQYDEAEEDLQKLAAAGGNRL